MSNLYDIYLEQAKQYHKDDNKWQGVALKKFIPAINQIIKDKVIEFQNSTDVALKDLPKIEKRKEIIIENKSYRLPNDC